MVSNFSMAFELSLVKLCRLWLWLIGSFTALHQHLGNGITPKPDPYKSSSFSSPKLDRLIKMFKTDSTAGRKMNKIHETVRQRDGIKLFIKFGKLGIP